MLDGVVVVGAAVVVGPGVVVVPLPAEGGGSGQAVATRAVAPRMTPSSAVDRRRCRVGRVVVIASPGLLLGITNMFGSLA